MSESKRKKTIRPGGTRKITSSAAYGRRVAKAERAEYVLRLYVTGLTPMSRRAIDNIQEICKRHLNGRYELQIIDIYQQPDFAVTEQIIAAPTLLKKLPLPVRRVIGDLSSPGRLLLALGLNSPQRAG